MPDRSEAGFAVGHVLVAIALMGALAAIAVPVSRFAQQNADVRSCQANQREIASAIATARDVCATIPDGGGVLDGSAGGWDDIVRPYIPNVLTCPSGSGGPDSYYSVSAAGAVDGDEGGPGFRPSHQLRE